MFRHFWDEHNGGLFFTADDSENLLFRHKEIHDGALSSGNSVAALNLLRLHGLTGKPHYSSLSEKITMAFSQSVSVYPAGHCQLMLALDFALNPNYQVVVVGKQNILDTLAMLEALRKPFQPNVTVIFKPARKDGSDIAVLVPFIAPMKEIDGQATAYVCENFLCSLPTTSIEEMMEKLKKRN